MRHLLVALALTLGFVASFAHAEPLDDALAAYVAGEYAVALAIWRPLAERGDARAQANLAFAHQTGAGVPQDYAQAVHWYRRAADQGDALAQWSLGYMHRHGQGVAVDLVRAYVWFDRAASGFDGTLAALAIVDRDEVAALLTPGELVEAQQDSGGLDLSHRDRRAR